MFIDRPYFLLHSISRYMSRKTEGDLIRNSWHFFEKPERRLTHDPIEDLGLLEPGLAEDRQDVVDYLGFLEAVDHAAEGVEQDALVGRAGLEGEFQLRHHRRFYRQVVEVIRHVGHRHECSAL